MQIPEFKNKVAVITGATGSLGQELAYNLARQGAMLVLAARNKERLDIVSEKCRGLGAKVIIVQTDVSQENQCRQLIDNSIKQYSRIDMLINNAAVTFKKNLDDLEDLEQFRRMMDVNFFGSVYCTRFALPYLKKTNGRIVGICSILGKIATPGNTAYCSSKFAMSAFFESLRHEISKNNISITMIYPGYLAEKMNSMNEHQSGLWKKFTSIVKLKARDCAEITLTAAAKRRRQVILPFYSVLSIWINLLCPVIFDKVINLISKLRKPA